MTLVRTSQFVACVALASLTLLASGCVGQSEYDAKEQELKKQNTKLSQAEQEVKQLRNELETAKVAAEELSHTAQEVEQLSKRLDTIKTASKDSAQTLTIAKAKIKALEKENTALKIKADKLSQVEQEAAQLQRDLDAAKIATKKAKQAAEAWIQTLEQEIAALKKQQAPKPNN